MKSYNYLELGISSNTPEKNLWLAVLEKMMIDYSYAVDRAKRCRDEIKKDYLWREVKSMIRAVESEHIQWICEVCEIHPDRIISFMYKRITDNSKPIIDLRFSLKNQPLAKEYEGNI